MASSPHTFIFSDLVGFTALAAQRGDDGAAEVALEFHRCVRELAREHRAEEIKTIGDGVMLRGEEPRDAIRLGVRIVDELESVPDFPAVRVGMHSGPAAHRAGDWFGTTVNVAARLCAAAGGGEVLASQATCEAAGEVPGVAVHDQRLHWLKNVADPFPAHVLEQRHCPARERRARRWSRGLHPAQAEVACT